MEAPALTTEGARPEQCCGEGGLCDVAWGHQASITEMSSSSYQANPGFYSAAAESSQAHWQLPVLLRSRNI